MISYCATLDVSRDLATTVARLLVAHHRAIGTRRRIRALTPWAQAVVVLRFFRDATVIEALARDNSIALPTAYRYVHEGIDVLADVAPELRQVIADAQEQGLKCLLMDGTLIAIDRVSEPYLATDRWYSGKHCRHGGNV